MHTRRTLISIFICTLGFSILSAQRPAISHSVICIGNAGDISHAGQYAKALNVLLDTIQHGHSILFTGDVAQPDEAFTDKYAQLDTLIGELRGHARRKLVFIPGDRDWDKSGKNGWHAVQDLEDRVRNWDYEDVIWPLHNGCPGPERVQLDLTLNLVVINTQWWNHEYSKPTPATATCKLANEEAILEEIKSEIEDASYGNLIVAGHYPIFSNGEYGGRFPIGKWLFPYPIVSSGITSYRQNVGSSTEIVNERYEPFREELEDVLKEYSSMVYVSGHERNREILNYSNNVLLGSGAPEEARYLGKSREAIFGSEKPGISIIDYDVDGNVFARQYRYSAGQFTYEGENMILQAPCFHPEPEIPVNERLIPCLQEFYVQTEMQGEHPENVTVAANPNYERSGFVRAWFGNHYRDTWIKPVSVPVLDLDTTHSGLVPYSVGGGRQTKSLKFSAEDGKAYVFRSVDKDPSKALSFDLRKSLISIAVQDQTTTQYPYGAVVASALLDSLEILHPRPKVYVMPDDRKLGPFQEKYGNMLGMLEDFPTGRKQIREVFADADKIEKSMSMFRDLYSDLSNRISTEEYARARVFDILVGDWSKHEDNWKWAGYKEETGIYYRPIPRDRDHVFSKWDGILPWISDREWAKPQGEHFGKNIKDVRSLTWQARHQDRFLASGLTYSDWLDASSFVQRNLEDSAIDSSMSILPEGVDSADVEDIRVKLKARRDRLGEFTTDFYELLAKEVDVVGSIEEERFVVNRLADGNVRVRVYMRDTSKSKEAVYDREFDPEETDEIRLFGLPGNDEFVIYGEARKSILIRVVPGQGHDTVSDSSEVSKGRKKTRVYSVDERDRVATGDETKDVRIPYDDAYIYRRTAFEYNTYLPYAYLFFSSGNGLQVGGGVSFTRQSYDKPDFSAKHNLTALFSTLGNVHFQYEGIIRHVIGSWDLTLDFQASKRRRFNYFFGLGNETEINRDSLANDYYTLRYSNIFGQVGLRRQFWKRSDVHFGLQIGTYSGESNSGNILDDEDDIQGVDPLRIARLNWGVNFDFRDRQYLPQRGMHFMLNGFFSQVMNDDGAYASTRAEVVWYGTAKPVTFSGRFGGWLHHNQPPYYHLEYLGQNNNLRGYRRNRFAGDLGGAFFNGDVRIQVIDNTRSLIPHKIGLLLFYDVGRVWQSEEDSNLWHQNFGVGIYAVPIRERFVIGLSIAFSKEEKGLVNFGFGKLF